MILKIQYIYIYMYIHVYTDMYIHVYTCIIMYIHVYTVYYCAQRSNCTACSNSHKACNSGVPYFHLFCPSNNLRLPYLRRLRPSDKSRGVVVTELARQIDSHVLGANLVPSGYVKIAIENDHLWLVMTNSLLLKMTQSKWWIKTH